MEFLQADKVNPYSYSAYGQQDIKKPSSVGNSSFKDTVQRALKTTESMEGIFEEASQTYGVSLNLLKAIGKAESGFNPGAVSSAGAQGVMQLMPATARSLGVEDSFDARSNIMGGAKYIASLLERYQGDTVLALGAYNAGSGNVEKYGGVPPFKETQNYIQKVLEYAGADLDLSGVFTSGAISGNAYQSALERLTDYASRTGSSDGISFSREDAQYMLQMMRLRMENLFQKGLSSEDEEENQAGSLI